MKKLVKAVRVLDWIGRKDDAETAWGWIGRGMKWLPAAVPAAVGWIMGNKWIALAILTVTCIALVLFLHHLEWKARERRALKRHEERKANPPWYEALAADMEPLADALQQERQDAEDIALLNRNRIALAKIAEALDERDIPHPNPLPPHRRTTEWETFLWNFVARVKAGEADRLPMLYREVQEAIEHRDAVHERFTRRLLGELPDDPKNG